VVTDPPTHKHIQPQTNKTGPITIHCTAASVQCNKQQTNKQTTTLVLTVSFWETWVSQFQKVKPSWILLQQEMMEMAVVMFKAPIKS